MDHQDGALPGPGPGPGIASQHAGSENREQGAGNRELETKNKTGV